MWTLGKHIHTYIHSSSLKEEYDETKTKYSKPSSLPTNWCKKTLTELRIAKPKDSSIRKILISSEGEANIIYLIYVTHNEFYRRKRIYN